MIRPLPTLQLLPERASYRRCLRCRTRDDNLFRPAAEVRFADDAAGPGHRPVFGRVRRQVCNIRAGSGLTDLQKSPEAGTFALRFLPHYKNVGMGRRGEERA